MKKIYGTLSLIALHSLAYGQQDTFRMIDRDSLSKEDSSKIKMWVGSNDTDLEEVTIRAYEYNSTLLNTPAAISTIDKKQLERFSNSSILPAVNMMPGVRMEERSPGSYRFGIRGSSAQSPFGVRNIKVYYNNIPFTDAGGNTYLNQLGYYNFSSVQVIKGPASSLYGAGTGGAVFIGSMPEQTQNEAKVHYTGGSYGLHSAAGEFFSGNDNVQNVIRYQHIESQGYREQSASRRDVFSWDMTVRTKGSNSISAHVLYSDLYYQTPGGLTLSQYNTEPSAARPATSTIPGATDNKAAIYQRSFLAGIENAVRFNDHWRNSTVLFASYNQLTNPNIRNYSRSSQPNAGARTSFFYSKKMRRNSSLQLVTGAEATTQYVNEKTYQNNLGSPGALTNDLDINNLLAFGFTQVTWENLKWILSGGVSINTMRTGIESYTPTYATQSRTFNNGLAPRLSLLRKFKNNTSLYVSAERGYTPPSISELAPTGSNLNLGLEAAQGWNLSIGCRGNVFSERLFFDVNMFLFRLSNTIVQRRDSAGGDYYINAGGTEQNGADILVRYAIMDNQKNGVFKDIDLSVAFTGYRFTYKNFVQVDKDYSGNRLPGVPGHTVNAALDLITLIGIYMNVSYYYSEPIFLNDANTDKAVDYTLLGTRLGYRRDIKQMTLDAYVGGDNLLNKKYSLGNDINAAGGRYYNAAPTRNYFVGLSLGYKYRRATPPKAPNSIIEITR